MDHFADIFLAYQKRGKANDPEGKIILYCWLLTFLNLLFAEIQKLDAQLKPWTSDDGPGKRRAAIGPEGFSIKYGNYSS